ncbi:MAG TPA: hypothetical protein VNZ45_02065 [Bacteroidia bacterium]|jgi:hypothetical protein|nr:hypothetical protein [Bacteroidia bacterium]
MSSAFSGKRLLLLLIPIYTIVFSCIFLKKFSPFYLSQPDPCYAYLFNGMNLASGNLEVGHIDHPGTTAQCFASVVIFIKHMFSSSGLPLYQDVILNAESYLYTCSIVLIVLLISVLYYTGTYVLRYTGNIGVAILFQLTPLINTNIIQRGIMLEPESVLIIVMVFFTAYLFLRAPEINQRPNKPINTKTVILFALFSGFLIATKYTCFPIIILILFILGKSKQRLVYLGLVIVSFFFFIIPALSKFKNMYHWVWSLFTHDEIYGTGKERIINPSQFVNNFKGIFVADTVFTAIYCVITLAFLVTIISRIRKKEPIPFLRTISGMWLAITVLIIAVAKHSDFHYFIFAECCFPFGLYLSYKILSASFIPFISGYRKHEKTVLYSFLAAFSIFLVIEKIRYIPLHYPKSFGINKYIDEHKDAPLVISVGSGLECERIEPSLFFGYIFSGNLQTKYAEFLDKRYPNSYIYLNGPQELWHWNRKVEVNDFLSKNKTVLMYLKSYDDTAMVNIKHKFEGWSASGMSGLYDEQELFKNVETSQSICLINKVK